jgi:2-amino-4-hydroxy-6-hydroxymethyldihydropteridine diphosphokinase
MGTIVSVVVIGVGTNLGGREAAVCAARDLLDARDDIEVMATSALYETEPLGPPQGAYLNAALRVETSLSPDDLLHVVLRTERRLGRRRSVDQRWGPRSVDLDLLWDARGPHRSGALRVPHAELTNRTFALAPLLDVAPELDDLYGAALARAGGPPRRWDRTAIFHREGSGARVDVAVEADSMADACALSVGGVLSRAHRGRAWSTRHAALEPSPERFADALRELFRTGFEVRCATISHCSQSQWIAQFHGLNSGAPNHADVRLQTTSGAQRNALARLSINPGPV